MAANRKFLTAGQRAPGANFRAKRRRFFRDLRSPRKSQLPTLHANDTDDDVFQKAGAAGLNFAFTLAHWEA